VRPRGLVAAALVTATAAVPAASGLAGPAQADSQTPVRLGIRFQGTARLHRRLSVRVVVTADAGVLDTRTGPLRIEVKLARECGGVFGQTPGTVLLNRRLSPQPRTGYAYRAAAIGHGRPSQTGLLTACTWLVESGDGRVFASDQSATVRVKR
jgi:hypothetical protein